jgi:hypothetical protein
MTQRPFPVGVETKTSVFVPGHIGCYRVTIHFQRTDIPNVIPLRSSAAPLDWNYKGEMVNHLMTPDLELLWEAHGQASSSCHEGVYWLHQSTSVFANYLNPILQGKKEQDIFKNNKDARYNPAQREMYKLLANSLSGKVGQLEHPDVVEIVHTEEQMARLLQQPEKYKSFEVYHLGKGMAFKGTLTDAHMQENFNSKKAHPCHLAALIYSYARSYMFPFIRDCKSKLGMDTDSLFVRKEDMIFFLPFLGSQVGQFTTEMQGMYADKAIPWTANSEQHFYMVAPKCYGIFHPSGTTIKARFKGISSSARFIDPDIVNSLTDEEQKAIQHTFGTNGEIRIPAKEQESKMYYGGYALLEKFPLALSEKVFQRILNEQPVFIVQSQITKSIFEVNPDLATQMGILRQRFCAKNIVLNKSNKRSSLSVFDQ